MLRQSLNPVRLVPEIVAWHHHHLPAGPLKNDGRVQLESDPGPSALAKLSGELHAILIHIDAAPLNPRNKPWTEDRNWLSAAFQALHEGKAFIIPNPWDAGSAKMFAGLGFEALATTSAGFAFTLGRPDGSITLAELVPHVRALDEATALLTGPAHAASSCAIQAKAWYPRRVSTPTTWRC